MINKYYEKITKFIKENYKTLLFYFVFIVVMTYPLPYYIYSGGGTIDVNDRVSIDNEYSSKGSFNLAYVSELKATLPTMLLSKILPGWDAVKREEMVLNNNETLDDLLTRDRLYLQEANQNAVKLAYNKALKSYKLIDTLLSIAYISEDSETDMKIGDVILSINGKSINTIDDFSSIISDSDISSRISVLIRRGQKEKNAFFIVKEMEGKKMAGLSFIPEERYETDPKINLHFSNNESGPSGGLMLTLSIYNKLIEEDITGGKKIVGTGTIDASGNVGAIGGVKYKLKGAVTNKADIFIVPNEENYQECIELQKKYNYDIKIIGVSTLDDAISKLKELK